MANNSEQQVRRLNELRNKLESLRQEQGRLAGERDGHDKRCEKLRQECLTKYKIKIEELPNAIAKLEIDAEEALSAAEKLLEEKNGTPSSDE